ncbi:MAG TPA: hypothetical protein VGI43_08045, partial [Mucilaginibacter sp.]
MKKLSLLLSCCFITFLSFSQPGKTGLAITPEPVKTIVKKGQFILPKHVMVQAATTGDVKLVTDYLKNKLTTAAGAAVSVKS